MEVKGALTRFSGHMWKEGLVSKYFLKKGEEYEHLGRLNKLYSVTAPSDTQQYQWRISGAVNNFVVGGWGRGLSYTEGLHIKQLTEPQVCLLTSQAKIKPQDLCLARSASQFFPVSLD